MKKTARRLRKDKRGILATEHEDSVMVADWLRWHKIFFLHIPNEGKRSWNEGKKQKRIGMRKGAPDFLIFPPPLYRPQACGTALELKRLEDGIVEEEQEDFLEQIGKYGWHTMICQGGDEAIKRLKELGYGKKGEEGG